MNAKKEKNNAYNVFENYIVKDTNKHLKQIIITNINASKTPETITITLNSNRKDNLSNKGRVNTKQWYEAEQQNNKSKSKNTTYFINKNTVYNITIGNESELAISKTKISKCNTYNIDSHDTKSKIYKKKKEV